MNYLQKLWNKWFKKEEKKKYPGIGDQTVFRKPLSTSTADYRRKSIPSVNGLKIIPSKPVMVKENSYKPREETPYIYPNYTYNDADAGIGIYIAGIDPYRNDDDIKIENNTIIDSPKFEGFGGGDGGGAGASSSYESSNDSSSYDSSSSSDSSSDGGGGSD